MGYTNKIWLIDCIYVKTFVWTAATAVPGSCLSRVTLCVREPLKRSWRGNWCKSLISTNTPSEEFTVTGFGAAAQERHSLIISWRPYSRHKVLCPWIIVLHLNADCNVRSEHRSVNSIKNLIYTCRCEYGSTAAGVLPEEQDMSYCWGWKLLRMETSQGQTLRDRRRKTRSSFSTERIKPQRRLMFHLRVGVATDLLLPLVDCGLVEDAGFQFKPVQGNFDGRQRTLPHDVLPPGLVEQNTAAHDAQEGHWGHRKWHQTPGSTQSIRFTRSSVLTERSLLKSPSSWNQLICCSLL